MNKPTLDKVRNYFYGRCNDGEEVRIQQWFADNGNSSEADRLLGALLGEVRSENPALAQAAFEEFCRRIGHSVPARTAPRRLTTVVRWTQRIAAVLIVPLLIAVSLLYTKTAHTPEWEEVLVPAGQRSELRLADGTLLWLNSGTRVTYPTHFNGRQRKIFVDGEVYAEVMHDKRHPFVISAGDVEVEVLGTKFNMRAYNSDQLVEVALVEGSVRFDVNSDKCDDEVVMVRNDVAQYDRLTGALEMTSFQSENYKSRHGRRLLLLQRVARRHHRTAGPLLRPENHHHRSRTGRRALLRLLHQQRVAAQDPRHAQHRQIYVHPRTQ